MQSSAHFSTNTLTNTTPAHDNWSTASRVKPEIQQLMRCPSCQSTLIPSQRGYRCSADTCGLEFPVVDGMPVLINEHTSVFPLANLIGSPHTPTTDNGDKLTRWIDRLIPSLDNNALSRRNYAEFVRLLLERSSKPRVLVIGGRVLGAGAESLIHPMIDLVETDIEQGPRTQMLFDAHQIPFADGSFDGIVIQAVLEHVLDPYRCVEEIYRVLANDGLVYAETPFMQQMHGTFDFTRFTILGHRRLFKRFTEVSAGAVCGPGMALAWSWQYFLLSFSTSKQWRRLLRAFARLTSFYLKYFDNFLVEKASAVEAASGYYFLGRKSDHTLTDHELLAPFLR